MVNETRLDVVIAVLTYKRPNGLRRALEAIERLNTDADVTVVVGDNDIEGREGSAVVELLQQKGFRFPIESFAVQGRGFTYGRNSLLERGFSGLNASFVALVDDDQIPDVDWLAAMMHVQAATGADVVGPAVLPLFEVPPPAWARASKIYNRDSTTEGMVESLTGDGGILIARSALKAMPLPWYDHEYALSGGADALLFDQLKSRGARFARSASAHIEEFYPQSRMTFLWAMQRAYRIGNVSALLSQRTLSRAAYARRELPKLFAALFLAPFIAILCWPFSNTAVDFAFKFARACGKIAGLFGSKYLSYSKVQGN